MSPCACSQISPETKIKRRLPLNHLLPRPLFLRPQRTQLHIIPLPRTPFQTSASLGRSTQTPIRQHKHLLQWTKFGAYPHSLNPLTAPRLPQSRGLGAGTLLWTTFSLSAGRATRLLFACGWTTQRTTSTRGELRWLVGERRGKDILLCVMWSAHITLWGRLTPFQCGECQTQPAVAAAGLQRKLCLS